MSQGIRTPTGDKDLSLSSDEDVPLTPPQLPTLRPPQSPSALPPAHTPPPPESPAASSAAPSETGDDGVDDEQQGTESVTEHQQQPDLKTPHDSTLDPMMASRSSRPQDAAHALATRQDIEAKIEDLFPYYTDSTTVHVGDFVELLGELGLKSIDVEDIMTMVVDAEAITASEATDVVMRLLTQSAGNDVKLNTMGVTLVHLTPWAFLKMKLTCGQQPHTHYKIDWSSVALGPSAQLQLAIALTVLCCGVLITLTIGLEWRGVVGTSEKTRVQNAMSLSGALGVEMEQRWTNVTSKAATDLLELHAAVIAARTSSISTSSSVLLSSFAGLVQSGVGEVAQTRTAGRIASITKWLQVILNVDSVRLGSGGVKATSIVSAASAGPMKAYLSTSGIDVRVVDTSGTVYSMSSVASSCNTNSGQPCSVANTPCFALSRPAGTIFNITGTRSYNGNTADAVGLRFANGVRVCAFIESSVLATTTATAALDVLETPRAFTVSGESTPSTVGQTGSVITRYATRIGSTAVIATTSAELAFLTSCAGSSCSYTTGTMFSDILSAISSGGNVSGVGTGVTSRSETYVINPVNSVAIITSSLTSALSAKTITAIVAGVNAVNMNMTGIWRHVAFEFGLATTSDVATPLTTLLDAADCTTIGCVRYSMAQTALTAAVSSTKPVVLLQQNYIPAPVICGATSITVAGLVLYGEARLVNVRATALNTLIAILTTANTNIGSINVEVSHIRGAPPSSLFAIDGVCSGSIECVQKGDEVLYRSDCPDCLGVLSTDISTAVTSVASNISSGYLEMLTPTTPLQSDYCASLAVEVRSAMCNNVTRSAWNLYSQLLTNLFATANVLATPATLDESAFAASSTVSSVFFIRNFSTQLSTFVTVSSYQNDAYDALSLAVGMTPILVVVIVAIEMLVTRFILRDIEQEWSQYTTKIQHESQMFSETVVDIFPIEVAERIMKGAVRISDAAQFTFLFVNIHQFEQFYRSKMEPTILTLFASYYYLVMSNVAQHFKLYRVRCIGDCVFIVGGISEDTRDLSTLRHVCLRTLEAAAVIIEMFSYVWSHVPSHVPCLRDITTSDRAIGMPSCKIGVHVGPAVMLVEPSSKGPPNFDVVGPHVGVAVAALQSAHVNTVGVTEPMMEALKALGSAHVDTFQFKEATRRLPTKVGTLKMHLMTAANVPVPPRVVFALGVRRAVTRTYFGEASRHHRATDSATEQSTDSGNK